MFLKHLRCLLEGKIISQEADGRRIAETNNTTYDNIISLLTS
jgi:hypothetical protein